MRFRSIALLVLAVSVAVSALVLRRKTRPAPPTPEGDVVVATPSPDVASPVPVDRAPNRGDVQPVLDRSFESALVVDADARSAVLAGDLNGDEIADLAVVVRPRDGAALTVLNGELPRFRLQDATGEGAAPGGPIASIAPGERLLAVVHGVRGVSWREDADRPVYLVRHGVGTKMRAQALADVPDAVRMRVHRVHAGDVIALEREGRPGVVFWTGAAYAWADVGPARPEAKGR